MRLGTFHDRRHRWDAHLTETKTLKPKTSQQECSEIIESLEAELERLKRLTNFGLMLKVVWSPGGSSEFSGTVKNDVIYVFEEDGLKTLEVLRHEFLDWLICQAAKPYEKIASFYSTMFNSLLEQLGKDAYKEKEAVVEALMRMFSK